VKDQAGYLDGRMVHLGVVVAALGFAWDIQTGPVLVRKDGEIPGARKAGGMQGAICSRRRYAPRVAGGPRVDVGDSSLI
jgi:hypothetical protein